MAGDREWATGDEAFWTFQVHTTSGPGGPRRPHHPHDDERHTEQPHGSCRCDPSAPKEVEDRPGGNERHVDFGDRDVLPPPSTCSRHEASSSEPGSPPYATKESARPNGHLATIIHQRAVPPRPSALCRAVWVLLGRLLIARCGCRQSVVEG